MSEEENYNKIYSAAFVTLLFTFLATKFKRKYFQYIFPTKLLKFFYLNRLHHMKIKEVCDLNECDEICERLSQDLGDLRVLGFDCEWVSDGGKQSPVALVQLASSKGLCALFRLCLLKEVPSGLKSLLVNREVLKVGVSPVDDAKFLFKDYGIQVQGCLDLRHIYPQGGGLASMSQKVIGVKLDKNWRLRCSNWEAEKLSSKQVDYAAKDALVAIEIFKTLTEETLLNKLLFWKKPNNIESKNPFVRYERYLDIRYKASGNAPIKENKIMKKNKKNDSNSSRGFSTRLTPLYDNCFMHAPDGDILNSCDIRKAEWYVKKGLAEVINEDPFSIKLLFEPKTRHKTEGGKFYAQMKGNHCVVCGADESYLRHNVVPREYRKYFPEEMKKHKSHDVVLMCLKCHMVCSEHDTQLKSKLAVLCDAQITAKKYFTNDTLSKLQSAAKAILRSGHKIPVSRLQELEEIIKTHYQITEITPDILEDIMKMNVLIPNDEYELHGKKVVAYYENQINGLDELQKTWREHFLNSMKPLYLPRFWSVDHNNKDF